MNTRLFPVLLLDMYLCRIQFASGKSFLSEELAYALCKSDSPPRFICGVIRDVPILKTYACTVFSFNVVFCDKNHGDITGRYYTSNWIMCRPLSHHVVDICHHVVDICHHVVDICHHVVDICHHVLISVTMLLISVTMLLISVTMLLISVTMETRVNVYRCIVKLSTQVYSHIYNVTVCITIV